MLADRLKALRKISRISQSALADKIGVTQQAVARWERQKSEPPISKLITLADFFGVTADDLLDRQVKVTLFSDDEKELVNGYRLLDGNDQNTIRMMINRFKSANVASPPSRQNIINQNNNLGDNILSVNN